VVTRQTVNTIQLRKYSPSLGVARRIAEVFRRRLESVVRYEKD
jgi:DNA-binding XRE family transcriptional regulator